MDERKNAMEDFEFPYFVTHKDTDSTCENCMHLESGMCVMHGYIVKKPLNVTCDSWKGAGE